MDETYTCSRCGTIHRDRALVWGAIDSDTGQEPDYVCREVCEHRYLSFLEGELDHLSAAAAPDPRPKTLFLDIDGVLLPHQGTLPAIWESAQYEEPVPLPGAREKLQEWDRKGYRIILTSGRRECMRAATELQLRRAGLIYDQLLLGLGGGVRVLINDMKPNGQQTAVAINLKRDEGIGGVEI
jgi:hypothetical protein